MPKSKRGQDHQIVEGKVIAILAYLSVLCIIPLIFQKDNTFVLAHGKQGLVIFVSQVGTFVIHILVGLWILKLGMFILLAFSFAGIIAVLRGQFVRFPVFSSIADQITL